MGLLDLSSEDAAQVVAQIRAEGQVAAAASCDVSDFDDLAAACEILQGELGSAFDIVINNAGISPKHAGVAAKVWEVEPEEWGRVIAVNLGGTFNTIRLLAPGMIARRNGAIVNISSLAGRVFTPVAGSH